jgi:hypothetical protein
VGKKLKNDSKIVTVGLTEIKPELSDLKESKLPCQQIDVAFCLSNVCQDCYLIPNENI